VKDPEFLGRVECQLGVTLASEWKGNGVRHAVGSIRHAPREATIVRSAFVNGVMSDAQSVWLSTVAAVLIVHAVRSGSFLVHIHVSILRNAANSRGDFFVLRKQQQQGLVCKVLFLSRVPRKLQFVKQSVETGLVLFKHFQREVAPHFLLDECVQKRPLLLLLAR
jgi:hypothetical protein